MGDSPWADNLEGDEDFFDYYGEAIEVNEPQRKKTKLVDAEEVAGKEVKPKRVVQNPQPKLDVEKLLNEERGLPELLRMVASIAFRPGKEVEDMRTTLSALQLWSHRLFPKYTFDDFLTKCEKLGRKRPIRTMLRKTRIGMLPS